MSGMNLTESQFEELQRNVNGNSVVVPCPPSGGSRKEKYGRIKKEADGIVFDSTSEAEAYRVLKLWSAGGYIFGLDLQPEYVLQDGFRDESGKWHRAIKYVADFRFAYTRNVATMHRPHSIIVVDVKGVLTPAFRIKEKLFRQRYPELDLQIWNRDKVRELSRG